MFPAGPRKRKSMFTPSFFVFLGLAVLSALICWYFRGYATLEESFMTTLELLVTVSPQLVLGVVVAGFVYVLSPREKVALILGRQSGMKGLVLASAFGAVMPGGPFASFPIVYALSRAGADIGALIAFLVAWAAVGVHRLLIWEVPFMGFEFAALRLVASLPLPIIAGLFARALLHRYPSLLPLGEEAAK